MDLRFVQLPPYRHRKRSRESFLSRLCCSLRSSVYMKHRIPPMLGASGFPFLFTRIHCFTANEKDFSLTLKMTLRESGILAPKPSPVGRLWCGAEVGSQSGIKRNGKEHFPVSSSQAQPRDLCCSPLPHQLCYASYMKHRIPHSWRIRLPVSVHTHTPIDRKRKRFLARARNDMLEKIAPHSLSYRRRFQPTKTARQNKKNQPFA